MGDFGPVTVGTSSVQLLANGLVTKKAWISNDSTNGQVVYLGLGVPAVVGQGIRLNPFGDTWETNYTGQINAISTAASASMTGSYQ